MKKVSVIGSSGFLGKIISSNLKEFEIIPVTRKDLDLLNFKSVQNWLKKVNPDVIVNCAIAGGNNRTSDLKKTNLSDAQDNLVSFLNFYNNSDLVKKYINIGSGAEFDVRNNIDSFEESQIFNSIPDESYGFSKNIISRLIYEKQQYYTIRLFGCFDSTEAETRFFKKVLNRKIHNYLDRRFDYISAKDFLKVLKYFILNDNLPKDINCVYSEKKKLSEILSFFKTEVKSNGIDNRNYTGDSKKIQSLNIKFDGLKKGIEDYSTDLENIDE